MKQLLNTSFSEEVKKICRKNRVLPEDFIFELPNIETIEQFPEAKDTLQKVKQLGFNLAIDDFDMNINHFDDIKDLGISNIMIEYSYIEKVLSSSDIYKSIFKALMDICNEEDIYLTVENVETFEQIEELKKLKILFAQGYYFSEPKPLQKFISDVVMTPWEVKKSPIDKKIESGAVNTSENASEAVGS
jgi:EAL domain-containing protein (putative c-di-GMP-specific phosphodiesterase class I)